jgi:hypothetical protein
MILTTKETLTETVSLWAVPRRSPKIGEFPFEYVVHGTGEYATHWNDSAILLGRFPISMEVPDGVDLYAKCLETLDHQAKDAMATYSQRMQEIDKRRESLLMLAHTPEPVTVIDGVELCDD